MARRMNQNRDAIADRQERRKARAGRRAEIYAAREAVIAEQQARTVEVKPKKNVPPFRPMTDRQEDYADAIESATYIFGVGPAGTGKTFVAASLAAEHLKSDPSHTVILTRPAVEAAGEQLGFLPGDLAEKFGPYMKPVMKVLIARLGQNYVDLAVKNERLVMVPMAFMRGESYEGAFILADEMQNASRAQFKMLLTRLGEGSRMVIDGDPRQSDIGEESGLEDAVRRLAHLKGVAVVKFDRSDIVRHDMTQSIIEAYEK